MCSSANEFHTVFEEVNGGEQVIVREGSDLVLSSGELMNPQCHENATSVERMESAIAALQSGKGVLVVDSEDRENEADLVFHAASLDERKMAMLIRECSGIVCLCITPEKASSLNLTLMVESSENQHAAAFTQSIEAAEGVTTGISAKDRVTTILAAIQDDAKPSDIRKPGHIFPIIARPGGVLERPGHTEATVDLMRLSRFSSPYGVLCELTNPDGTMARYAEIFDFSKAHGYPVVTIDDIVCFRNRYCTLNL